MCVHVLPKKKSYKKKKGFKIQKIEKQAVINDLFSIFKLDLSLTADLKVNNSVKIKVY